MNSVAVYRPRELVRKSLPFVAPYRAGLAGTMALALAIAATHVTEPLVLMKLFDELSGARRLSELGTCLLVLVGLLACREALSAILDWGSWRIRVGVNFRLTRAIVQRLHSLPVSYHQEQNVGALMTRVDRGITGAVTAFAEVAFQVFPSVVYFAIALIIMARLDWRLTLIAVAFAPLAPGIGAWAAREQTDRERSLMDRWTSLYSRLNEVLSSIIVIKSFAREEAEGNRFLRGVESANDVVVRGVRRDASVSAAKNLSTGLARLAVTGAGAILVARGEVSLGALVAFLGYVGGLFGPVQGLTGAYQTLRKGTVGLETVLSLLDAPDCLQDAEDSVPAGELAGHVEFRCVQFGYDESRPVLRGVTLEVHQGETVALVGPSGAGKSTLMALVQRLYDPTGGSVRIDGRDVREFQQRSLRSRIGVVLQDTALLSDSILDNIRMGAPDADESEVMAAARAANAHEFISRLPQGYRTLVGERGCKLSAGQKQRIAIARALLRDPSILILDEPTSALDAESEAQVQQALARLKSGRTTFVIAHRLATVLDADRIVVLRNGEVFESGTHEQLMRLDGLYASMARKQHLGRRRKSESRGELEALREAV